MANFLPISEYLVQGNIEVFEYFLVSYLKRKQYLLLQTPPRV